MIIYPGPVIASGLQWVLNSYYLLNELMHSFIHSNFACILVADINIIFLRQSVCYLKDLESKMSGKAMVSFSGRTGGRLLGRTGEAGFF